MTIWEKCNELKGTTATREQIADWAYMNRVCPLDFDIGLELDVPYPPEMTDAAHRLCHQNSCGMDCLRNFLNTQIGGGSRGT